MSSRIQSSDSLSSGVWRKAGKPDWWAYYTNEEGAREFLETHDSEGREELDIAVQVPVGTHVTIGVKGISSLTETVVSTEIPEEWKDNDEI
jgi:hypothetical protein